MDDPAKRRAVEELLDGWDSWELRDRLHDVSPHVVYEVVVDGRRAVCKRSVAPRGRAGVEGLVLRHVDRETSVPVPEVLAVAPDGFVAAYRDDALDPGTEHDDDWCRPAGRALARLHEECAPAFDRPGELRVDATTPRRPGGDEGSGSADRSPRTDRAGGETRAGRESGPGGTTDPALSVAGRPDWPAALDDLLGTYERSVRGTGFADVVAEARSFLRDRADRFRVGEATLLHGWFSPEHAAVADGAVTCVVDFEHAVVGSPEWDYWRTAVPVFDDPGAGTGPEASFRAGYESVRPLPEGLDRRGEAYRTLVLVSYLDSLAVQRGIDEETRDRAERLRTAIRERLSDLRREW